MTVKGMRGNCHVVEIFKLEKGIAMDTLTLVITALTTGSTASVRDTASESLKDAYSGLKTLIQRKFAGKPAAEIALAQYEAKPDVWRTPLEEELREAEISQDENIIKTAQWLMTLTQPQQAVQGKFDVQIIGNLQDYSRMKQEQVV
jgi:hypothetical protein